MKEFLAELMTALSMLAGDGGQEPNKEVLLEKNRAEGVEREQVEQTEEASKRVSDGKFEYDVPEDAPWWNVVRDNDTEANVQEHGVDGEITTIWGTGTRGQGEITMDNPRKLQMDGEGNIYFIDGDSKNLKLRKFNGHKNETVIDLSNDEVSDRWGQFYASGLAYVNNTLYLGSNKDVYEVVNGHLEIADKKIGDWMDQHRYGAIYRIEPSGDYIYMLLVSKSYYYTMVRYNTQTREIEELINQQTYPDPYNFSVYNGGAEFFLATDNGYVIWEKLFPRETIAAVDMADPEAKVLDVWTDSKGSLYYSVVEDRVYSRIYKNPIGPDNIELVAGDRRGYKDAIQAGAEMDHATDFIWDGSGWIFADQGNHSIRKLWMRE